MPNSNLPDDYLPFPEMTICGNSFVRGTIPITIDGHALFLIGRDEKVWLQVPIGGDEWEFVISPTEITDSAYEVKRLGRAINIYFGHHLLLQANKESDVSLMINHLDFRSIGFSIYGTTSGMNVGGMQLTGNSFEGVDTMVGVG